MTAAAGGAGATGLRGRGLHLLLGGLGRRAGLMFLLLLDVIRIG